MTEAQKACLEKLKAQTKNQSGTVNMCGRQIWDIVRTNPDAGRKLQEAMKQLLRQCGMRIGE